METVPWLEPRERLSRVLKLAFETAGMLRSVASDAQIKFCNGGKRDISFDRYNHPELSVCRLL